MPVVIEIVLGPFAGQKVELQDGQCLRVGRTARADFAIPQDDSLSSLHFSLTLQNKTCVLRDLGSTNGTFLNQSRVLEATLSDGDRIDAGGTSFSVSVSAEEDFAVGGVESPAQAQSATVPSFGPTDILRSSPFKTVCATKAELLRIIAARPDSLFGLLDAARDSRVLDVLRAFDDPYESLYQGEMAAELATVAPYLVHLPKTSALLPRLIDVSWGESWGVYLTSTEPLFAIRKHLRHFLTTSASDGRELYFRFYDPRVLRVYLPTCTADERSAFFGPVSCFLIEGEKPGQLLVFSAERS